MIPTKNCFWQERSGIECKKKDVNQCLAYKAWFPYMCQQDAQQRTMPHDVWTPMISSDHSLRNKSLRGRNKVAHVELLRGLARPVPRYAVIVIYRNQQRKKQKRFCLLRKKRAKAKTKKIATTFGKSLFLIKYRMHYAIYMTPNTKDLAINQQMIAIETGKAQQHLHEQTTPVCCDY